VIEAYSRHRALIVRPDDVWLAILTQFCFFVKEMKKLFATFSLRMKGSKNLRSWKEEIGTTWILPIWHVR
jgi:hypothetical protein